MMVYRRSALSKKFGHSNAKILRRKIIVKANAHQSMDVDEHEDKSTTVPMEVDQTGHIFAARTKPVDSNKFKKMLGADFVLQSTHRENWLGAKPLAAATLCLQNTRQ